MRFPFLIATLLLAFISVAHAQRTVVVAPSGTIVDASTATLGTTSTQVLAAVPQGGQRTALFLQLETANGTVGCNPNSTAVIGGAGTIVITGQYSSLNWASLGAIPNTALSCVADGASRTVTIYAFPQ